MIITPWLEFQGRFTNIYLLKGAASALVLPRLILLQIKLVVHQNVSLPICLWRIIPDSTFLCLDKVLFSELCFTKSLCMFWSYFCCQGKQGRFPSSLCFWRGTLWWDRSCVIPRSVKCLTCPRKGAYNASKEPSAEELPPYVKTFPFHTWFVIWFVICSVFLFLYFHSWEILV